VFKVWVTLACCYVIAVDRPGRSLKILFTMII